MKPYTKLYLKHFGYGQEDFIPCEICGARAVDIHHIDCRGMGGTSKKDSIENLMALCRIHHIEYGDKKEYRDYLVKAHQLKLKK
jgi:hypothetical protein